MKFHGHNPPSAPTQGDIAVDSLDGAVLVFDGSDWVTMQVPPPDVLEKITAKDLIDHYPELKEILDPYITMEVIKRSGE